MTITPWKDSLQHSALSKQQNVTPELRILLIDENRQRAESLTSALNNSRYTISHLANSDMSLLKQVDEIQPDIIVIDIESPSRDILESLSTISHYNWFRVVRSVGGMTKECTLLRSVGGPTMECTLVRSRPRNAL